MRRSLAPLALAFGLAACPSYDRYGELADQRGYMSADDFARYGAEQAQKVAIGRKLAQEHNGRTAADYARQVGATVEYARTLPDVVAVKADTQAYFLTITFKSGWSAFVTPIDDGKPPEATPGLAAAPAN